MDSTEIETTELKYLWLLKKVAVRSLLLLLNVYEYAKENSGDFKEVIVSTQNVVVPIFEPLYVVLKDLPQQIMAYVDGKFDEYASPLAKELVIESQSLIYKTKPIVKKLVTTTQTIIKPLITATIFLLKTTGYLIQSITPKPTLPFSKDQTPLHKSLNTILQQGPNLANQAIDTTKSLVGGLPLMRNVAQSPPTNPIDLANQITNTTNSLLKENPLLEAVNSAAQNSDKATKSLVGGIPLFGNVAQSPPTNPIDLANQITNTTNSLLKENPLLEAVNSAAQNSDKATKSLVGGIPLFGNVAQSLTTNPADLANQITNTTNSLLKENPLLEAVNSATQNSDKATKSLVGGIPLFGNVAQSLTNNPADLVNQIVDTTNSLVKENPVLNAVNSAAQNSLDTANSLVVGDIAESLTNPAELANQILNTTNSIVNDNPLLGAINTAAGNMGLKPEATGTKAALQAAYMTLKLTMIPVIAQIWYELVNRYPTLGEISEFILPLVEAVCVVYNKAVKYMDEKGYSIAGYLPLVPVDEMKAAYKLVKASRDGLAAVGGLLGIDNNKGLSAVGDLLGINKNK